ncbi:hypothetical protein RFI_16681, partial [Reticulomyxa filosa]
MCVCVCVTKVTEWSLNGCNNLHKSLTLPKSVSATTVMNTSVLPPASTSTLMRNCSSGAGTLTSSHFSLGGHSSTNTNTNTDTNTNTNTNMNMNTHVNFMCGPTATSSHLRLSSPTGTSMDSHGVSCHSSTSTSTSTSTSNSNSNSNPNSNVVTYSSLSFTNHNDHYVTIPYTSSDNCWLPDSIPVHAPFVNAIDGNCSNNSNCNSNSDSNGNINSNGNCIGNGNGNGNDGTQDATMEFVVAPTTSMSIPLCNEELLKFPYSHNCSMDLLVSSANDVCNSTGFDSTASYVSLSTTGISPSAHMFHDANDAGVHAETSATVVKGNETGIFFFFFFFVKNQNPFVGIVAYLKNLE